MNTAIEFHDSTIVTLQKTGATLRIVFDPAYVHHSEGRPGFDAGEGHLQIVEMEISGATTSEESGQCMGDISDGIISVDGRDCNASPILGARFGFGSDLVRVGRHLESYWYWSLVQSGRSNAISREVQSI
jgi:hypothetical protein